MLDGEASVNDSKNAYARVHGVLALALLALTMVASSARAQTADSTTGSAPTDGTAATPDSGAAPEGDAATDGASADSGSADTTTATTTTTTAASPPSDASALGDGSGTTTTPTTTAPDTTTTTTPTSGNPDEVAEEIQSEREPLAWRNSYFNYSINSSFCSFSRDCQLSYNPTVYTFMSLSPRWYLDPATFFSFYQAFYIEHTDDDGATYQHEFQLFDTRIALNHREALGDNFLVVVGGSLWLPTSKGSQAQQRYFRLGGSLSATWSPNVGGFNLSLQTSYVRWFAGSNTALTQSPYAGSPAGPTLATPTGDQSANQASSTTGEVDRISAGITANWAPLEGFTITLQIFYFWIQGWGLGNAAIAANTVTGSSILVGDTSPTHWRAFDSYAIYFQYDFVPWFQGWIGFANSTQLASVISEDGSVRSPVNLYDMQVSLGATITLDSLYESFAVSGEDDGLTPEQRQRRRQGLAQRSSSGGSL